MPLFQNSFSSSIPVSIQNFGNENPDCLFYLIYRKEPGSGFFSNVFHVMGHLQIAEDLGLIPVVDMKNFRTYYNENASIHGTYNAWEYYFLQPSSYSLDAVYNSNYVLFCDGEFRLTIYRDVAKASSLSRYIHVRKEILDSVSRFQNAHFTPGRTLGIHFRGQEMKTTPNHPSCPTPEQVIARTKFLLDTYPIETIFIVSEEKAYIDLLCSAFGKMVVFTDAFRTYDVNAYNIRPSLSAGKPHVCVGL